MEENDMLEYLRRNFPGRQLVYQAHPNETTEHELLDLRGFVRGEKTIAEIFLYQNAGQIEYVFSACSAASASAYAMGFNSAIFLEACRGAVDEGTIINYRSYFAGTPESFFIKNFTDPVPTRPEHSFESEAAGLEAIRQAVGSSPKIWVLAADPALALRTAILVKQLKEKNPKLQTVLLKISQRRWEMVEANPIFREAFSEIINLPNDRVWYSVRPAKIKAAIRKSRELKGLGLSPGDTLISLTHLLFEENCLLSYYREVNKILLIENRWYHFSYNGGYRLLPKSDFHASWGGHFFNYCLEPLLRLHRTLFREYRDGQLPNYFRYRAPLERVYDTTFVLMP